ncbi:hypothetical protein GW17_00049647 [Ensete ventricosum]|nr:hypothetical protein GW17_00049647 [Ensete ventricosum]RZR99395.1 hypothetical protein BHM03_00028919 [Ensete ventricosum]
MFWSLGQSVNGSSSSSSLGYLTLKRTKAIRYPNLYKVGQTSSVELCCLLRNLEDLTTVDFGGGDAATAGAIGRSEGQREKRCDGVGKVPLLVGADAIVVVHKEDDLVQKHALVEELRKPTGSIRGRESRRNKSPTEEEKADALEVFSFNVDERLPFDSKKR